MSINSSFSVCVDSYYNPYYFDEPNEFDYLDKTEDFVDTTSIKYRAAQLEPVISKAIFFQQKKAEVEQPNTQRTIVALDQGTKEVAQENIQAAKSSPCIDNGPFWGAVAAGFMFFMTIFLALVLIIGLAL